MNKIYLGQDITFAENGSLSSRDKQRHYLDTTFASPRWQANGKARNKFEGRNKRLHKELQNRSRLTRDTEIADVPFSPVSSPRNISKKIFVYSNHNNEKYKENQYNLQDMNEIEVLKQQVVSNEGSTPSIPTDVQNISIDAPVRRRKNNYIMADTQKCENSAVVSSNHINEKFKENQSNLQDINEIAVPKQQVVSNERSTPSIPIDVQNISKSPPVRRMKNNYVMTDIQRCSNSPVMSSNHINEKYKESQSRKEPTEQKVRNGRSTPSMPIDVITISKKAPLHTRKVNYVIADTQKAGNFPVVYSKHNNEKYKDNQSNLQDINELAIPTQQVAKNERPAPSILTDVQNVFKNTPVRARKVNNTQKGDNYPAVYSNHGNEKYKEHQTNLQNIHEIAVPKEEIEVNERSTPSTPTDVQNVAKRSPVRARKVNCVIADSNYSPVFVHQNHDNEKYRENQSNPPDIEPKEQMGSNETPPILIDFQNVFQQTEELLRRREAISNINYYRHPIQLSTLTAYLSVPKNIGKYSGRDTIDCSSTKGKGGNSIQYLSLPNPMHISSFARRANLNRSNNGNISARKRLIRKNDW